MYGRLVLSFSLLFISTLSIAATLNINSNNTSNQAVYIKLLDKDTYPLAYETVPAKGVNITSADSDVIDYFIISLPSETDPGECKINITQDYKNKPQQLTASLMYNDPPLLCMLPNGASKVTMMPDKQGNFNLDVLVKIS
jgi:hypothetical protein